MPTSIEIEEFIKLSSKYPVIDVRTSAEYEKGHIPNADNVPLFTNEERIVIGTLYKQEGREPAILKGLELVGPRLKEIVEQVNSLSKEKIILIHCWRGGMRSGSIAWLLELYGYKVYTLKRGYKAFRNFVLKTFIHPRKLLILGGRTGSGKTLIIQELAKQDKQIIDLEKISHHKGSSFGSLGEKKQPSQEQFENELAMELCASDASKTLWLEDESRKIGVNIIPEGLWIQMRNAKVIYIDIAWEARVKYLVQEYGRFNKEELKQATIRIAKRLGGQHVKKALEAIENNDLKTACEISLVYYDKTYDYGISQRDKENIIPCSFETIDLLTITKKIKKFLE